MLTDETREIIRKGEQIGWIMEPEAIRLLSLSGIDIPKFNWAKSIDDAEEAASKIGYPLVAKVVSSKIVHKSDSGGVIMGIDNIEKLRESFSFFSKFEGFEGVLVEEVLSGIELIVGAKIDYQFGPVVLLGAGGTGVEIYKDVSLKMAPIVGKDVESMVACLKARQTLGGYRGSAPVNIEKLKAMMLKFSDLVMDLEDHIESIDMNPVICSRERCVTADARIILKHFVL